jgi:putative hydrolase of the HAD superfamily
MSASLLLFDLDETVAPDEATDAALFQELMSDVALRDEASAAHQLAQFDALIERLWQESPAAEYSQRLGISPWEGLGGPFGPSEHPMLAALHDFVPGYRCAAWEQFAAALDPRGGADPRTLEERFLRERRARQGAYPWSAAVLHALAGRFRLGMITNGAPDLQRLKLDGTGLAALFDPLVVSGDLDVGKPERAIFEHALQVADAAPSEAVMVGDSWARDMLGALPLGIRGAWVNARSLPLPSHPASAVVVTIRDLRELPAALPLLGVPA